MTGEQGVFGKAGLKVFFLRVTCNGDKEFGMGDVDGDLICFGQMDDGPPTTITPGV